MPTALAVAGAAGLAAVALHFIARSRPVAEPLPTARFIPERPIHARTRSIALTDVPLLLVRLAAIGLLGVAVAGPMLTGGGNVTRIVIADRSRAVQIDRGSRDSVRAYLRAGDQLIVFDSAASLPRAATLDSLVQTKARGSLSAALAAAIRAAVRSSSSADSVELVLVSSVAGEEFDAATAKLRAAWPGRIRVVRAGGFLATRRPSMVEVRSNPNDAVAAALSLAPRADAPVRVVRGATTADDSAWARDGRVLVHWPATEADADWPHRASIDAIGGVSTANSTVVARFPRLWALGGRAIARWADGEPAAVEREFGQGCLRDVSILIDETSDLTLRMPFHGVVADLVAPCGGYAFTAPSSDSAVTAFAGVGRLAALADFRDRTADPSRWTPWLLLAAALLLIAELAVRRAWRSLA